MPFVRFHLPESVSDQSRDAIGVGTQTADERRVVAARDDVPVVVAR